MQTFTKGNAPPAPVAASPPPVSSSSSKPPKTAPKPTVPGNNGTVAGRQFTITDTYEGKTFFNEWNFFNQRDPTDGQVQYLDRAAATKAGLAFVQADGAAVLKVDNSVDLPLGQNRKSVRVTSKKQYNEGLFVFDVAAMPFGCSVWPALWTVGPNWPNSGEIDIIEGVHNGPSNRFTLHTGPTSTCKIDKAPPTPFSSTSRVINDRCASKEGDNAGCSFLDEGEGSYGEAFNKAGGAVIAMLWNDDGIKMWRFLRAGVPSDITSRNPQPNTWPEPSASFASTTCPIKENFKNQNLVIDITLCGGFGTDTYKSAGCPGTCQERVMKGSNFNDAVWKINSVVVYK